MLSSFLFGEKTEKRDILNSKNKSSIFTFFGFFSYGSTPTPMQSSTTNTNNNSAEYNKINNSKFNTQNRPLLNNKSVISFESNGNESMYNILEKPYQISFPNKEPLYKITSYNKSQEKKEDIFYFVENESEFQTFHLIMAREGTEAGDYYNQYTYDFLKEKFNNFTLRKPLSIIEEVKNRFVDWSSDILEDKIEIFI